MQKTINPKLKWVERVSYLMDEKFRLPGTNFKFGLDPLINLIPGAGSLAGFAISSAMVLAMARYGVSRKVLILMALNVALDSTIGAIPVIGQIFDFTYKSNSKNIKLLKQHYEEGRHQGSGKGVLITIMIVLIVFLLVFLYVLWQILEWVTSLF